MKKHGVNKFIGLLLFLSLITSMLFSFVSLAEAYTGAYLYTGVDPITGLPITEVRGVNPTGQTFTGENKIEMNAYNNAPILTDNTFNGSTDIDTAFTDITSNGNTYNGTTTLEYSSVTGGTLQSSGDSFRATSVDASDADVSISNGTFNGALSINANSVSLGSITQMDSLLDELYVLVYHFTNRVALAYPSGNNYVNVTSPWTGNTVQVPLFYLGYSYFVWNGTTETFDRTTVQRYSSFQNIYFFLLDLLLRDFTALYDFGLYQFNYIRGNGSYQMYSYSLTNNGEFYSISRAAQTVTFRDVVINRFDTLIFLLDYYCKRFFNWYYPLDDVLPEYWRVYNTDTQEQEDIGLAGLLYNISWYLGQLYALQVESGPLTQLSEDVDAAADSMASMEAQEEAVISSISSGITSFVPDLSELGAFTALAWCSNYLQQCWISLGMYGTVIMIGLLLAVCMQFIGYFRYK